MSHGVHARLPGAGPPYDDRVRAAQVTSLDGPTAVEVVDLPEPAPTGVLVEVHEAGVSFPDVLLSRGQYQMRPSCPSSRARVRRASCAAPASSGFAAGDRVAAFPVLGGFAETVAVPGDGLPAARCRVVRAAAPRCR